MYLRLSEKEFKFFRILAVCSEKNVEDGFLIFTEGKLVFFLDRVAPHLTVSAHTYPTTLSQHHPFILFGASTIQYLLVGIPLIRNTTLGTSGELLRL